MTDVKLALVPGRPAKLTPYLLANWFYYFLPRVCESPAGSPPRLARAPLITHRQS